MNGDIYTKLPVIYSLTFSHLLICAPIHRFFLQRDREIVMDDLWDSKFDAGFVLNTSYISSLVEEVWAID